MTPSTVNGGELVVVEALVVGGIVVVGFVTVRTVVRSKASNPGLLDQVLRSATLAE